MDRQKLKKNIKGYGISLLITALLIELLCMVMVESGYIEARVPTYTFPMGKRTIYVDNNENWGVWRMPNDSMSFVRRCFDVMLYSNSYGALDKEHPRQSPQKRVVVLGDSFVEGYGVAYENRFSTLLSDTTGFPHLNFGTSGNFGPTQYYLLYKHLASDFDHGEVLIFFLPSNDFQDDYPDPVRYNPYWEGNYPDYTLRYSMEDINESKWSADNINTQHGIGSYVRNFSYSANVIDYISSWLAFVRRAQDVTQGELKGRIRYQNFTEEEILRVRYSLEQIKAIAGERPVRVVMIPSLQDFVAVKENGQNPLAERMQKMAGEVGFRFFDLLPAFNEEHADRLGSLFHTCDGHWSPYGHQVVTDLLYKEFYQYPDTVNYGNAQGPVSLP